MMAEYKKALKRNPDEVGRSAKPVMYTKSLEGGPPASEYASKGSKTEGPNDVLATKAKRNSSK
jgi:hypothetical protein